MEAMRYLAEFGARKCFRFPTGDETEIQNFVESSTAMLLASSKYLATADAQIKSGLNFSWQADGLPTPDEVQQIVVLPGLDFSLPNQNPEQTIAAWLFIKYFQTQDAQELWIPAAGNIPLVPSVAASIGLPNAFIPVLILVDSAEFIPAYPQVDQIDILIQEAMESCINGSPVEQVLDALQDDIVKLNADFYTSP
jgi:ABC-type glycerol-3-phosphate transport system substrate-binding protein